MAYILYEGARKEEYMKKFWLLIILLGIFGQAQALEYTDYSDFSDFTSEYAENNDLTDVKVERRYKYYYLEKELGEYGTEPTLEYPYIDKEDFISTDYSNLSPNKPEERDNRIIDTVKEYYYEKVKDVNYIEIGCLNEGFKISNIKVIY